MRSFNLKKIAGVTLIELLIGILVTSLMMGAMFTTYRVVQGSYQQVTDKAKVSRSSRDVVGMIIKDIRLAGFKYYHGENDKDIPVFDDLSQIIGFGDAEEADGTVRKCSDSHAPIIVFRNTTDYVPNQLDSNKPSGCNPNSDDAISATGGTNNTVNVGDLCCDMIHIVYGDFDEYDPVQNYKKYKITYFAKAEQDGSDNYFSLYKTKESWIENDSSAESQTGYWAVEKEDCPECYHDVMVRDRIVDMEFQLFDENGIDLYNQTLSSFPVPDNDTNVDLYRIRVVDMRLSFRSKKEFYKSEASGNKLRLVKALGNRSQSYTDRFLRDSVVVSIHTRNIGG